MTQFRRKATPALAWRFEGQPQSEWPAWVKDYEVSTNMGLGKIAMSGVGVLLVPIRNGNTLNGQKGDYIVLEHNGYDTAGKVIGGTLTLVKAQDFPNMFEPHVDPSVSEDKAQPVEASPAPVVATEPVPATPAEEA